MLSCLVLYKDFYLTFIYYLEIYQLILALWQFYYLLCNLKCWLSACIVVLVHKECEYYSMYLYAKINDQIAHCG